MSTGRTEQLRDFLKRSRTDLSKNGPAKDRFVGKVMAQVEAILVEAAQPMATAQPELKPAPKRDPDRVITIKAKNLRLGPGGVVQMTGSESMQADEELGRSPFANGRGGNDGR